MPNRTGIGTLVIALLPGTLAMLGMWLAHTFLAVNSYSPLGLLLLSLAWCAGCLWLYLRADGDSTKAADAGGERAIFDEFHEITAPVIDILDQEVTGASAEVERVQDLIAEAVDQLSSSFQHLSQEAARETGLVQEIVERSACRGGTTGGPGRHVGDFDEFLSAQIGALSQITRRIDTDVGHAVRSLQFEDIARQSLGAAKIHLDQLTGLRNTLQDMRGQFLRPDPHMLEDIRRRFRALKEDTLRAEKKAVVSESMAAGEIELF